MRTVVLCVVVLVTAVAGHGVERVVAGEAGGTPTVPRHDDCQVAPRALPLLASTPGAAAATAVPIGEAEASPTAFVPPDGAAADEATVVEVTATVREALACRNAGDFGRAYALFSDRMMRQLFGGEETIDPEIAAALDGSPHRVPRGERLALISVSDVRQRGDGSIGAVVETQGESGTYRDYLSFVKVNDRWLIDSVVTLGD
jgi:hypothetical protein